MMDRELIGRLVFEVEYGQVFEIKGRTAPTYNPDGLGSTMRLRSLATNRIDVDYFPADVGGALILIDEDFPQDQIKRLVSALQARSAANLAITEIRHAMTTRVESVARHSAAPFDGSNRATRA